MADSSKVRLVRCPKCENLLSEPKDSPFFQCGGCFTVLRAKIKERDEGESDSVSEESKAKAVSSPEEAVVDSSETSSESDSASLGHKQEQHLVDIKKSDPCSNKTKASSSSSILVGGGKDDPKSQSGRQESGLDRFRKRFDSESRLSTPSKYPPHDEATSSDAIERDRAGLLRELERIKEQLVQSCNVASSKPKEQQVPPKAPPLRFHSSGHGPSSYYNNDVSMHPPSYGRVGPPPPPHPHPYFSGQYVVGNNNNAPDLFDPYPQQQHKGHFQHQACSCYHCYNTGFYHHESAMGFAPPPPPHNPRVSYGSRGLLQHHGRWPSHLSDGVSRIRPSKVVLSGDGSRHIRPLAGGAPFITCQNCFELLQLPKKPEGAKKVRCGACSSLIDLSVVDNKFVLSTNSTRQVGGGEARAAAAADYTSDDYDLLGYVFHSLDDEPRDFSTARQNVHSHSTSLSEEEEEEEDEQLSSDSLTAKPVLLQAQDSPLLRNDYASISHDRSGVGSQSARSEQDKVVLSKTVRQNSMKEVSLASEMEVSFNDYSQDQQQQQRSKKNGFASIVKKSFKDLTKSIHSDDGHRSNVSINGHSLTERLVKKAEKRAGSIQPGNYWYDFRAGFWGVMGGPGLGILPPFIEELNYPMGENCSGGTTGVFVNGRELHRKDLELLAGRGLPRERDRSYIVDITGRVIDEDTGEELDCLGKLAPTIEKLKRGFGMRLPKRAS